MSVARKDVEDLLKDANTQKRICDLPTLYEIDKCAAASLVQQRLDKNRLHPIRPSRGDIFMANITTNGGNELSSPHPVIVISNNKGNKYTSKVIVVAIEGDGSKINSAYQMPLSNTDLLQGRLDKDPSRIILSEILTIDKTRLAQKIGIIKPDVLNAITFGISKQLSIPMPNPLKSP